MIGKDDSAKDWVDEVDVSYDEATAGIGDGGGGSGGGSAGRIKQEPTVGESSKKRGRTGGSSGRSRR